MKKKKKELSFLRLVIRYNEKKVKTPKLLEDDRNHLLYGRGEYDGYYEDAVRRVDRAITEIGAI